jgi:A/G-specific adenine glycosylase
MLQQTQVNTVIPYYHRFLKAFPTILELARSDEERILKLWEGLGYYTRARNLHRAAGRVMAEFGGVVPCQEKAFRTLPGVGPYIAAAVLSMACGLPLPVLDGNVIRVMTRFLGITGDIKKNTTLIPIKNYLQGNISLDRPGDYNQALMDLGAMVCRINDPRCSQCPLKKECQAEKRGLTDKIPFRSARTASPHYPVALAVIFNWKNQIYIQKRPSRGHLGGLWEFPGGKIKPGETSGAALIRECREELNIKVKPLQKIALVNHAYTHFKITLHVFACRLGREESPPEPPLPHKWIALSEINKYPFPGANHKLFPLLEQWTEQY